MNYPTKASGVRLADLTRHEHELTIMKIMIVDDEDAQVVILRSILRRAGFQNLTVLQDPREALAAFDTVQPDLLLLDVNMPHLSGFQLMESLQDRASENMALPILMLTADARATVKQHALAKGARDFLAKPFDSSEVVLRVRNLLETRRVQQALQDQNATLEEQVNERTKALENSQIEMLVRLARAAEYRDDKSGEHVWRVARLSAQLAGEYGLEPDEIELLTRAARLHDVGKIVIPDSILLKPTGLTPEEFEVVKTHTTVGAKLLSGGCSPLMKLAETVALTHHERWDGRGYPCGLRGDAIPLAGRILALADTVDALTHNRVHQQACTLDEAAQEVFRQMGKQFDPVLAAAFLRLFERGEINLSGPSVTATQF